MFKWLVLGAVIFTVTGAHHVPGEPHDHPHLPIVVTKTDGTMTTEVPCDKDTKPMDSNSEMMMEELKPLEEKLTLGEPEKPLDIPEKLIEEPMKLTEEDSKNDDAEPAKYNGAQLLRVKANTPEQKELLDQLEESRMVDTWLRPAKGNGQVDIMVPENMVESVKMRLADVNATYEVVISNVQTAIEAENPAMTEEELSELAGRAGHRMTWQSYHRMSDIHGYLDYLAQTYPDIVTVTTIGTSIEGNPLKLIKISPSTKSKQASANRPAFWIDGGIHAREWISPASVSYIIQQLVEQRDENSAIVDNIDYYILPVVNPDGYEYTFTKERLWRKNRRDPYLGSCAGTDLNRNWGYKWGGLGSSRDKCKEIYAGSNAFSEPETKAIKSFVEARASSIQAYVTFHSYGQYILYPWGYDRKVPPDYTDLDRVGKQAAAAMRSAGGASYTVGNSASLLYPASGGADDWAKGGPRIKYTYTIELRDKGQYGFLLPATYIIPTAKEAFAAVKTIAQAITLTTT